MLVAMLAVALAAPWLHRKGRVRMAVMVGVLADWLFYLSLIVGTAVLRQESLWEVGLFATTLVTLLVLYLPPVRNLCREPPGSVAAVRGG
ncbi:MAG: hypothetical protein PVF68_10980 [Acidobacteriota bacterium]|jgi:hypothetical protein